MHNIVHYLDDFLVVDSPGTTECKDFLDVTQATCAELGVPLAVDKVEGPTTSLSFLGIQLDSLTMQASLPVDKLVRLRSELTEWQDKKSCMH